MTRSAISRLARGVGISLLLGMSGAVAAQEMDDPHAKHRQMMQSGQKSPGTSVQIRLPDANLFNRHGQSVSFRDDVIADRIIVIDFVYTTCTTVCPVLSAILRQVQERLGERLGNEVVLVSITVDPLRDTPQRLQAYAEKLRAGEGWVWLTGNKQSIDEVLQAFGAYTPNFEDHPSMMLVGDARTGEWSRYIGFPGVGKIIDKIDELGAAHQARAATGVN